MRVVDFCQQMSILNSFQYTALGAKSVVSMSRETDTTYLSQLTPPIFLVYKVTGDLRYIDVMLSLSNLKSEGVLKYILFLFDLPIGIGY